MNRFMLPLDSRRLVRCSVGIGFAVVALLVRLALEPFVGQVAPWSVFFLAVVVASIVGGFAGGVAAIVSAVGLGSFFLIGPSNASWSLGPRELAGAVVFAGVALSITVVGHSLRRALQRRDAALTTLDALIDNSPIGISLFDRDRRFVRLNNVVARTTGIEPAAHLGHTIAELLPKAPGATERMLVRVIETGETIVEDEVTAEAPTAPGTMTTWQVSVFPVSRQGGRVTGVGLLSRDVTMKKAAEAERAETLRFAEQFMGILAHDLRNPLAAVRMAAARLKKSATDVADASTIDRILSASGRMDGMINQLLDLTRGRLGGGIAIERKEGDLRQAVAGVVAELRLAFAGRQIDYEAPADLVGSWDFDRLAQVVSNLVGNALVHGDPDGRVLVRLAARDSVMLSVHNEGRPIPASELARIFDPYHRGRTPNDGLGLGLFIANQIVLAHGGEIVVASSDSGGTTFTVLLPRAEPPRRSPTEADDGQGRTDDHSPTRPV